MISSFDPGALLSHFYPLADGSRVRLRLVQRRDESAIRALLRARGSEPEDLVIKRLVSGDPRRRAVICATALVGSSESLVGVGAIDLEGSENPKPDLLLVEQRQDSGLHDLLLAALCGRATAIGRARAA